MIFLADGLGSLPCISRSVALYARKKLGLIDVERKEMDVLDELTDDGIVSLAGDQYLAFG